MLYKSDECQRYLYDVDGIYVIFERHAAGVHTQYPKTYSVVNAYSYLCDRFFTYIQKVAANIMHYKRFEH
jgi:hypothetical protein